MFKNVQSDERMSLNDDNLEKLVVHCFIKIFLFISHMASTLINKEE